MSLFEKKRVVLTGGNSGIGFQTVKALYGDGHDIIFGSRDQQRNAEAVQKIQAAFPSSSGTILAFKLDLSNRQSIQSFANQVKKRFENVDILLNNAGLITNQPKLAEIGYEFTMATNHFGHFYLTYLLFDTIAKSKQARIINVSSYLHFSAADDIFNNLDLKNPSKFSSLDQYNNSKFANVLFTVGLNDRLSKYKNIKTACLHPGGVDTNFGKGLCLLQFCKCLCCCLFVSQDKGAISSLSLSRRPFNQLKSGQYYDQDGDFQEMDKRARNKEVSEKLWRISEEAYKIKFNP